MTPAELRVDVASGRLCEARFVASPNFDPRPPGMAPEILVIHAISLPPGQFGGDAIERLFCNALDFSSHPYYREIDGLEVSSHLLIRRDGELVQFVPFGERAWHAGVSCCEGRERVNDFSIGIELEGSDDRPFEPVQYAMLVAATRALLRAYPTLDVQRIYGHADIAPGRKTDPGPYFDWPRYRASI
jgi:N-acetyl-anhydromuramoyl-L-alanine amidase